MRLALIALALIPAASTAAEDRPADPDPVIATDTAPMAVSPYVGTCPSETARIAKAKRARPELRKLTDLPDANAYSAVFRTDENGCPNPIVISYQVGRGR
jgi:hypothetical protein